MASALIPLVPPRSVVGFYMDKGVETVVGFMGAVYAGCAYSQLNLRHPAPRVRAMLETLDTPIVVTDRAHLAQMEDINPPARILLIEELEETPLDEDALSVVRAQMIDADPLYVNFTSGSTGTPKGVVVCHRNVCEFIPCFAETFAITESDVLANQAPFDFDVSVKDIYSGLFTGARVEIVPTAYFTNPTKLMDFLCDRGATLMVWAVSALCFLTTMNALAYKTPTTLRAILFSGEVMPIKHLHKLQKYLPGVQYVNLYGPTEITCNCTYYIVDREFAENETLPIGVPFKNERILLLTPDGGEAVQDGEIGELCVSGTSVALGYYKDAERTAACFTQNPLNHAYLEPIYRTGDLVKVNERGEMVYVSRKDFQIKHMGHRIELSEIEVQMTAVPGVERALCAYLEGEGQDSRFLHGRGGQGGHHGRAARSAARLHDSQPLHAGGGHAAQQKRQNRPRRAAEPICRRKGRQKGGATWITSFPLPSASARRASSLTRCSWKRACAPCAKSCRKPSACATPSRPIRF